ncbi:hypothetical protein TNCV_855681 [Trichonephila clavipes]|nr:hypothetical protein TNCV_855681 [Trichonephila clavipes]
MTITSDNSFAYSLRWKVVHRLESDQSEGKLARWLQVASKWSPGYGINSKQVILLLGRSTEVAIQHRHLHKVATWH